MNRFSMLFISCMLFCGACSDNTAEKEPTSAIVGLDKPIVSEVSYNSAIVQVNIKGALLKEAGSAMVLPQIRMY